MTQNNNLIYFLKYYRTKSRMTQEELAEKAGVGLRFIRDLEQGKESLRMDKVNQVFALFGHKLVPGSGRMLDPYEILMKYVNNTVHLFLNNRTELYGLILEPLSEEREIKAWKFVSNTNIARYKESEDTSLVQIINHSDIEKIENL